MQSYTFFSLFRAMVGTFEIKLLLCLWVKTVGRKVKKEGREGSKGEEEGEEEGERGKGEGENEKKEGRECE